MKDRKELVKDMENIQGGFDEVSRIIGQARQETMETRIKTDNGKVELEKLLGEVINILSLSLEARGVIRDVIGKIRRLQRKMNRRQLSQ